MTSFLQAPPRHLFRHTMTVKRPTPAVDDAHSTTQTYANHLTGVKCLWQPQSGNEFAYADADRSRQSSVIYTDPGLDIQSTDQIVIEGRTLKITGPPKNSVNAGVILRIDCDEVTP